MPTALRVDGFSFSFYAGDHEPPHVHVRYGGAAAVIEIGTGRVRSTNMRDPDLARASALVRKHAETLSAAWFSCKLNVPVQNDDP
jgi:hypothetical protein